LTFKKTPGLFALNAILVEQWLMLEQ
jgi:hypothetical protein